VAVDPALTAEETAAIELARRIVDAVRADRPAGDMYGQLETLEIVSRVAEAERAEGAGARGLALFIGLTGGRWDIQKLDQVRARLSADPPDPEVLEQLRPEPIVLSSERSSPPPPLPHDAISIDDAAGTLETMLGETRDPEGAFRTFVKFAKKPVAATAPLRIDNDMCLFEGTTRRRGNRLEVEWDAVRQFSLGGEGGEYSHMEQLHLTITYTAPESHSRAAATPMGGIWSGEDIDAWAAEIEKEPVVAIPGDPSAPARVDVYQERI
jgi:hypothetical protein